MKIIRGCVTISVFLGLATLAFSQDNGKKSFADFHKLLDATEQSGNVSGSTPCAGWEDKVKEQCLNAFAEYYKHEASVFNQRYRFYEHHLLSTQVILVVVVVLVLSGLAFAGVQFWFGLVKTPAVEIRPKLAADAHPLNETGDAKGELQEVASPASKPTETAQVAASVMQAVSEIEISMTGLKARSSILGLLLVIVSMGFFYLYIRYVYPMEEGSLRPTEIEAKK